MKKTTIDRITRNAEMNRNTIIGAYTYTRNLYTGEILRCKTDDIGREWIDWQGNRFDAWYVVS